MGRKLQTVRFKNAKVFFRIFPMEGIQWQHVKILEDLKTIYIRYLPDFGHEGCVPSYWKFETDGVFYNNTQNEIYDAIMDGVLDRVIEGNDAIILTYGQTGSGKSLTASGVLNSFKDRGVAPRLITALFQKKVSLKNKRKMCIQMSYIETLKMYVNDLLNSSNIVIDSHSLKNIKILKLKTEYIALKTLFKVEGRRQFTSNDAKSHAANGVLTLHIMTRPVNQTDPVIQMAKLVYPECIPNNQGWHARGIYRGLFPEENFIQLKTQEQLNLMNAPIHIVDLAGADSVGNITALHKNAFQIGTANLAKTNLEQFVMVLCQNHADQIQVKQRLNVLIQYLGESLNSRSILRCIGHIRTDRENLMVTSSMLRFGQIVRGLRPQKLQPNVSENKEVKINQLKEEVDELQREKDIEIMLQNSDLSTNLNQERIKHMQNVAEEYLQNKTNVIVLLNVTDTATVMKVFKDLYNKLEAEKVECTKHAYEQAYEDALANIQRGSSDTGSKGSRKGSFKSLKSKDHLPTGLESRSFTKGGKKSSKTNIKSGTLSTSKLDDKQSGVGLKADHASATKLVKRTKSSSLNIAKRSVASRRKSTSSNASPGAHDAIPEEMSLPQALPAYGEAWDQFISDEDYNYKGLNDIVNTSEENAKIAHKNYMNEMKNLQKCQEVIDIRKYEIQKAQMIRMLKKEERDEDGNIILGDLEKSCIENFNKAQEELVQQQEIVLKNQTEFCIALEIHQNAKSNVMEKYEQFCRDKFQAPVPKLPNMSDYVTQKGSQIDLSVEEDLESVPVTQRCRDTDHYENYQQIMKDQIQKKIKEQKKPKGWVRSCKS